MERGRGVPLSRALLAMASVTAAVALTLFVAPSGRWAAGIANGSILAAALLAAALFARKARRDEHATVWGLLSLAMVAFAVAEGYWFVVEVVLGDTVGAVSPADSAYFAGYVFLLASIAASFPGAASLRVQVRIGLDGIVVFATLTAIAWIVGVRDLAVAAGRPVDAVLLTFYPTLDLMLATLLLFLLREIRGVHRPRVLLLGTGMILWLVVDVLYAVQSLRTGFASGLPLDALWVGGYVAFALSALVRSGPATAARTWTGHRWIAVVNGPVAVLVPLSVLDYAQTRTMDAVLFALGVLLIASLTGRQALFSAQLLSANRRLRRREADLHERVKELDALYSVASESARSRDVRSLVHATVDALERAFLHDDVWVQVEAPGHTAASRGDPPETPEASAVFDTPTGPGRVRVRYRSGHEARARGPFLAEEQALLDGVARLLSSATDRLDATDALVEREEDLANAQRIAHVGSWTYRPATDAATWSREMYLIFERPTAASVPGPEDALASFLPESRRRLRKELDRITADGGSYVVEATIQVPSGTKHVVSRGESSTLSSGAPILRGTVQDVTQRRQAEQGLRFQANLLSEVGQAVFATDMEGTITFWNPAAEGLYGWSRGEAEGRPVHEVLGAEHTAEVAGAEGESADHWIACRDGSRVLVNLTAGPMLDADGRLAGFIGVAQDVTRQRATQKRYQEMVENSPNGIIRSTPAGALEFANQAAAQMLGFDSPERLIAEVPRITGLYVDPRDRDQLLAELQKPEPGPFRTRMRRRDGTEVWVEIRARMHGPEERQVIEGTFFDLTATRQHQELLQHLAVLVDSSDEAIYSKSLDGTVQTWNPGAQRLFGYTEPEATGRRAEDLVVPSDRRDEYQAVMDRVRAGHASGRFETVRLRKDGTRVDVSLSIGPLFDASGTTNAVLVSCHDITDRRQAQDAERARLENEHLKELDQTLRDFVNAAAHDLNQPLTPMRLSLSLLDEFTKDMPESAHNTLGLLRRSVDRMALLLEDMLDVARLHSGTLRFDIAPVGLDPLLQETVAFFGQQAREVGITLCREDGDDIRVEADGRRVIQVLFNLVGNAMKFTPEGSSITIRARADDEVARVEVVDTGSGLTREQMDRLFQAFSQVHDAHGPRGTGLGLYISRGIIEKHGGRIGVESAGPGKGSTFWFDLPLAAGPG